MHQKLVILPSGTWSLGLLATVGNELKDKASNSGVAIYRAANNKQYFLGFGYSLYRFDVKQGTLEGGCYKIDQPPLSGFGQRLSDISDRKDKESLDPSGQGLWNYIESSQLGESITSMPASKYYKNLIYLGRFGLVRSVKPRRGNRVGFVPASKGAEPRFGLDHWCG